MIDKKGNDLVEIDGYTLGFRFGTWAWLQTQKKLKCKGWMSTLERMGLTDGDLDLEAFATIVSEARNEYIEENKTDEPLCSVREACDIITKMGGAIVALEKFESSIRGYQPKNLTPPQPAGEPELTSQ